MSGATNQLVRKFAAPVAVVGAFLLGGALFVGHGRVHAASMAGAAPMDDNSVSALTSLDRAMEAVAARVTPAVVNVAVTSRGNGEVPTSDGQMQGLPQACSSSSAP